MFACLLGPNCCELQQQSLVDSRIGEQNMFTHLLMDPLSSWFQEIVCFVFVSCVVVCGVEVQTTYIHTCIFSAVYVGTCLSVQFGTKGIQVKQNNLNAKVQYMYLPVVKQICLCFHGNERGT